MLTSKYANPLENFINHGIKTISSYNYILLVDEQGQAIIQRVATDNTDIKFKEMTAPSSQSKDAIAGAINTFWATPDAGTFVYLFQLQ